MIQPGQHWQRTDFDGQVRTIRIVNVFVDPERENRPAAVVDSVPLSFYMVLSLSWIKEHYTQVEK